MIKEAQAERRRAQRLQEAFRVDYSVVDRRGECFSGTTVTKDISASGLCIYCRRSYPPGAEMVLAVSSPSGALLVRGRAKVKWLHTVDEKYMIGMQFIEAKGAGLSMLSQEAALPG